MKKLILVLAIIIPFIAFTQGMTYFKQDSTFWSQQIKYGYVTKMMRVGTTVYGRVSGQWVAMFTDTIGSGSTAVDTIYRTPGKDSIQYTIGGRYYAIKDSSGGGSSGWGLTGNSGTTAGTNFVGTSDSIDLVFKTYGSERYRISANGFFHTFGNSGTNAQQYIFKYQLNNAGTYGDAGAMIWNAQIGSKIVLNAVSGNSLFVTDANGDPTSITAIGLKNNLDGTLLSRFSGGFYTDGRFVVGNNTSDVSAALQVNSTTQGFLPPRMTGAQAEAISSPAEGLLIYCNSGNGSTITSKGWWGYDGTTWVKLN